MQIGTRIGVYDVLAKLGEGGMGAVYRARDTKLDRDVAIKVLPESFASDPDRLMRFEREAKTLASLNHPNIAGIYGIEDGPAEAGHHVRALVMELVEGEDLSARIARLRAPGASARQAGMPLDEALPIAKQIAEALEAAHDRGIIHRDLKPANIKVRADGTVKVLDFGLAKAIDQAGGAGGAGRDVANSPTITSPAMTQAGVILGTAAYMAPEQARGRATDRRVDLWAFGCVLYEMLTGRRAFDGDSIADVLGAVVRAEPDWAQLPAETPAHVRRVLERCLRKDPALRIAHASAVRQDLVEGDSGLTAAPRMAPSTAARTVPWAVAAVAVFGAVALLAWLRPWSVSPVSSPPAALRLALVPPPELPLFLGGRTALAISPDGAFVVYTTNLASRSTLVMQHLDRLDAVAIADANSVSGATISPDGKWIAFASGTQLKKVSVAGGVAITLCSFPGVIEGMSWAADERILFASQNANGRLFSVPVAGGSPVPVSTPDIAAGEQSHVSPFVLPGGGAALFTVRGDGASAQVAILDLKTGVHRVLLQAADAAAFMAPGYLVYRRGSSLWAAPIDLSRGELTGEGVMIVPDVASNGEGAAYAASQTGILAYAPASARTTPARELVWVDRTGKEEGLAAPARQYRYARLSPDQTRIAFSDANDIWLLQSDGSNLTRLTFEDSADGPTWTPDGARVIYRTTRSGVGNLWWRRADGTGTAERLTDSPRSQFPFAVTSDGKQVLIREDSDSGNNLALVPLDGKSPSAVLVPLPFGENSADLSPDGRWLAYQQNAGDTTQVFLHPFPDVQGGRWQVSSGQGTKPRFSADSTELFFRSDRSGELTSVKLPAAGPFGGATPATVMPELNRYFNYVPFRPWDVAKDGRRFLMVKFVQGTGPPPARNIIVLSNFLAATTRAER